MNARAKTATLIATSLGFSVIQLDVTVVNVAVHRIGEAFGGGVSELQWVVGAYTLMFAALILAGGALGDRFGARRVLLSGFVVFVCSSVACGAAPSIGVLIAARAAQGAGAALLGSCSLSLLSHTFQDSHERTRAIGLWAAGASSALSAGPLVGGLLIASLGWRSIFFINVPIGAAGMLLAMRFARETDRSENRRLDPAGQLLAVVALASLAAALIEAGRRGFADGWVLAGFGLFALSACLFTLVEWRGRDPMLPLGLFTQRTFTVPSLIGLLANICFYGLIFVFSLLFQVEHGYSALRAGIAFVPMTAAILTANLYAGRLSRAIGPAPVMLAGLCGMGVACAGLFWIARSTAYAVMLPQQVLLGAGLGLLVPPMTGSVLQSAERTRSGIAAGTLTAMRQSGSLLGIALFGSLVGGRTGFFAGVHASLAISLGALALAAFLALALTRADARMRRATAGEHVPASESSISG